MSQNGMKVTLWNWTPLPVETIYCEWQQSRSEGPVPTPQEVRAQIDAERQDTYHNLTGHIANVGEKVPTVPAGMFEREVRETFERGIEMKVPMSETLQFLWLFEGVSVSWREQAVRHQIGHKFGGAAGFDQIPALTDSSFWVQSMRQKDMGSFAERGEYYVPETIVEAANPEKRLKRVSNGEPVSLREFYEACMKDTQAMYNTLVKAGIPLEDARNVLPMGCTHRLVWSMNATSMYAMLSKRTCWIAQLGMWEPVISQMIEELREKVDPYFAKLADPPCIGKDDEFHSCPFELENIEYIHGRDPHHPCPLWTNLQRDSFAKASAEAESPTWVPHGNINVCLRPLVKKTCEEDVADRERRTERYVQLWHRDPKTGKRIKL